MAGSLFKNYPYDIPTEAFSLALFTQAFATVQASIVHLQDVTLSKRFALVPLGPPLLSYSSTSKVSHCFGIVCTSLQCYFVCIAAGTPFSTGKVLSSVCALSVLSLHLGSGSGADGSSLPLSRLHQQEHSVALTLGCQKSSSLHPGAFCKLIPFSSSLYSVCDASTCGVYAEPLSLRFLEFSFRPLI